MAHEECKVARNSQQDSQHTASTFSGRSQKLQDVATVEAGRVREVER